VRGTTWFRSRRRFEIEADGTDPGCGAVRGTWTMEVGGHTSAGTIEQDGACRDACVPRTAITTTAPDLQLTIVVGEGSLARWKVAATGQHGWFSACEDAREGRQPQ
jgi:hypothetical protein